MALCLLSAALADAGSRSLLFGSLPRHEEAACLARENVCDWDREEFRASDGSGGACFAKRPTGEDLTWYDLDHGKCTVNSANATHVTFSFGADSGIFFSAAPYKLVLDLREKAPLSNMQNYGTPSPPTAPPSR